MVVDQTSAAHIAAAAIFNFGDEETKENLDQRL